MMNTNPRSSGILLHPTSLPGRYGIGELGGEAYHFVDYLESAGQTNWQILPLGPTSYGDSPYQTLSAMAGNPLLISFDGLLAEGWLEAADLADMPNFPIFAVDYGPVITYRNGLLSKAYANFVKKADAQQKAAFDSWCAAEADWLDDYALFIALKNKYDGRPWVEWSAEEASRKPVALDAARKTFATAIADQKFRQWVFHQQWLALKGYANQKGIKLIGDIPIFVAHDSSDVWANPDQYFLDQGGNPTVVAGVPPDYFSATGQRWGNPLYRWDVMQADGFKWWIKRVKATLSMVDIVRIDHFRGFEAYWEIPASEPTAVNGRWLPGIGAPLFDALIAGLGGNLPIIAEDLGVITPGVQALRDGYQLPGMKVLQFAFSYDPDGENVFLPHNYPINCIVYTGTHDNNTTVGWWSGNEANHDARQALQNYVGHAIQEPHWEMIRLGMSSVGATFIAPLQDILGFGADTRMNTPGKMGGNWGWRFERKWLDHPSRERLLSLTRQYGRYPKAATADSGAKDWAVSSKKD
jgi:4-alpha-glucanotransferase